MGRTNQKGFTLIELMTVVAIIATLATLGVPQYRKFQRRARRAEGNMVLGVTASTTSVFRAEYGALTTNLGALGIDLESRPKYYTFGFPGGDCGDIPMVLWGLNPNEVYGLGIDAPSSFAFRGWANAAVSGTLLGGNAGEASVIPASGQQFPAPTACLIPGLNEIQNATAATNPPWGWEATATGNIGGTAGRSDQLKINLNRQITLVQDGST